MALTDQCVSFWKFNESSGNAVDSAGPNDLTNNNSVSYSTGLVSNAAYLNVASDSDMGFSITDASQTGLDLTGDFTFSTWLYITTAPTLNGDPYTIITKYGNASGNRGYIFIYKNETGNESTNPLLQCQVFGSSGGHTRGTATADLGTGAWKHVMVTFDASAATFVFYLNNSALTTKDILTGATDVGDSASDFYLGSGFNTTQTDWSARMRVDATGIWSRILTSDERTELYNAGAGYEPEFATAGGIVVPTLLMMGVG